MKLVDLKQCQGHTPPHHFDMRTFPLVPKQAGQGDLAMSLSDYLPGGGAEFGPQPVEVIFYVLDGTITVQSDGGTVTVEAGQAVHISKGENKGVRNLSHTTATMLVIACVPDSFR